MLFYGTFTNSGVARIYGDPPADWTNLGRLHVFKIPRHECRRTKRALQLAKVVALCAAIGRVRRLVGHRPRSGVRAVAPSVWSSLLSPPPHTAYTQRSSGKWRPTTTTTWIRILQRPQRNACVIRLPTKL